jgi:hypothetical protein
MQRWREWRTASASHWGTALQRVAVIRPLAEQSRLAVPLAAEAAARLRLGQVVIYRRVRRYQQRPQTSSLLAEDACYTLPIRRRPILVNDLSIVMS